MLSGACGMVKAHSTLEMALTTQVVTSSHHGTHCVILRNYLMHHCAAAVVHVSVQCVCCFGSEVLSRVVCEAKRTPLSGRTLYCK